MVQRITRKSRQSVLSEDCKPHLVIRSSLRPKADSRRQNKSVRHQGIITGSTRPLLDAKDTKGNYSKHVSLLMASGNKDTTTVTRRQRSETTPRVATVATVNGQGHLGLSSTTCDPERSTMAVEDYVYLQPSEYYSPPLSLGHQVWPGPSWYTVHDQGATIYGGVPFSQADLTPGTYLRGSTSSQHINELIAKYSEAENACEDWNKQVGLSPEVFPASVGDSMVQGGTSFLVGAKGGDDSTAKLYPVADTEKSLKDFFNDQDCYDLDWLLEDGALCPAQSARDLDIDTEGIKMEIGDWLLDTPLVNLEETWLNPEGENLSRGLVRADSHGSSTAADHSNCNTESFQPTEAENNELDEVNNSMILVERSGENNFSESNDFMQEKYAADLLENDLDFGEMLDNLMDGDCGDPSAVQLHE